MNIRLTKQIATSSKPGASRYTLWDCELRGFGLRIGPSGVRTWVAKYRAEGGGRNAPQKMLTLGTFPTVSATEARLKARTLLSQVAIGNDPAEELAARRREMTVAQLIDLYEARGLIVQRGIRLGEPMKATTAAYTMSRLRNHVVPLIGAKLVKALTEKEIERLVADITKGVTALDQTLGFRRRLIVRGGPGAARKVVRDLSAVLSFAQRRRIISTNPVSTASVRKTDNRRQRYLNLGELQRLGLALRTLEEGGTNLKAINIVRLLVLTGARRNEIAGLKWTEVDLEDGLLRLGETKTGKSIRPLGESAVSVLRTIRGNASEDEEYVFPAERGHGFYTGTKKVWPLITIAAGLVDVTPHTLRHTLGSVAASSGEALLIVGSILGHKNARSTELYAHVDRDPARLAADRATAPLAAALGLTA